MSRLFAKPIIACVLKTWRLEPGMTYALVEDLSREVWIVESCPAGTHFWTLDQAQELASRSITGRVLQTAVRMGRAWLIERRAQPDIARPSDHLCLSDLLPLAKGIQTVFNSASQQNAPRPDDYHGSGRERSTV